jgi:hypothetical protein
VFFFTEFIWFDSFFVPVRIILFILCIVFVIDLLHLLASNIASSSNYSVVPLHIVVLVVTQVVDMCWVRQWVIADIRNIIVLGWGWTPWSVHTIKLLPRSLQADPRTNILGYRQSKWTLARMTYWWKLLQWLCQPW